MVSYPQRPEPADTLRVKWVGRATHSLAAELLPDWRHLLARLFPYLAYGSRPLGDLYFVHVSFGSSRLRFVLTRAL
jgi:hypothetical protein